MIRTGATSWGVYGLVVLALVLLYVPELDRHGYWEDEIYTARDIGIYRITDRTPYFRLSFSQLTYSNNNHPPFYFWLLEKWVSLFGFSEIAGRGFSLMVFALLLLQVVRLLRHWVPGRPEAPLMALCVFGCSSYMFSLALEARMYTLVLLWISLSLDSFRRCLSVKESGRGNGFARAALAAANTLGLYTHYYFSFFYAAELILAGYHVLRRRLSLKRLLEFLIPALLFLPWLPQFLRQYRIKAAEGLWVQGPRDLPLYFRELLGEGSAALLHLVFGFDFEALTLLALVTLACVLYRLAGRAGNAAVHGLGFLGVLALLSYLLLATNDLFHGTVTLTRVKYLFFLAVLFLLGYLLLMLGSLPPVRVLLLVVFLGYNLTALARQRTLQPRPDWRAITRQVEILRQERPIVVPDIDFWICLRFYLASEDGILRGETLPAYPEEFWYLAPYLPWNTHIQKRVAELGSSFVEVERIKLDRFSDLIRYSIK